MAGFDADDFAFLDDGERDRLSGAVRRFLGVVLHLAPTAPTSPEEIERAEAPFLEIVRLLEFDRYEDPDAFRIGKLIEASLEGKRPDWVAALKFKTGVDSTGDPGLWIWAYLADEAIEGPESSKKVEEVRDLLDEAARKAAPDRWPYLHFRSKSEMEEEPMEKVG